MVDKMFTPNTTTTADTSFNMTNLEYSASGDSRIGVLRLFLSLLFVVAVMLLSSLAGYYHWQNRRLRKEFAHQQSIQHETVEACKRAEAERIAGERAEERTLRERDLEAQHWAEAETGPAPSIGDDERLGEIRERIVRFEENRKVQGRVREEDHGQDDHRVQVEDPVNEEDSRVQGRAEGGDQGPFGDEHRVQVEDVIDEEHRFMVSDSEDEHDEFVNTKQQQASR
jgi:hypothetical protein